MNGIIFNIQSFCIHDGDGIRTCVFLKGCPLRCIWCHNPESFEKAPTLSFFSRKCSLCGRCFGICSARSVENGVLKINRDKCEKCGRCAEVCLYGANEITGKETVASDVVKEVLKDKIFFDASGGGVTVTGGEPSFQPEFTLELLSLSKDAGISVAVETCGIGPREFYEKAADLGTTFLFDIKCIDPDLHRRLTGADNAHIMSNLRYLMDRDAEIIIRLPMIPECNDSDGDIALLSAFLAENKSKFRYAEIMPYHSLGTAKAENAGIIPAYTHENATEENVSRWRRLFASHGVDVKVSE